MRVLGDERLYAILIPHRYLNTELGLTAPDINILDLAENGEIDKIWLLVLQGRA